MSDDDRFTAFDLTEKREKARKVRVTDTEDEGMAELADAMGVSVAEMLRRGYALLRDTYQDEKGDLHPAQARSRLDKIDKELRRDNKQTARTFFARLQRVTRNSMDMGTHPKLQEDYFDGFLDEAETLYRAGILDDELRDEFIQTVERKRREYREDYEARETHEQDHRYTQTFTDVDDSGKAREALEDAARAILVGNEELVVDFAREAVDADAPIGTGEEDIRERAYEYAVEGGEIDEFHGEKCLLEQASEAFDDGRKSVAKNLIEEAVQTWPHSEKTDAELRREFTQRAQKWGTPDYGEVDETEAADEAEADETPDLTASDHADTCLTKLTVHGPEAADQYAADHDLADDVVRSVERRYASEKIEELDRWSDRPGAVTIHAEWLPPDTTLDDLYDEAGVEPGADITDADPPSPPSPGDTSTPRVASSDGGRDEQDDD